MVVLPHTGKAGAQIAAARLDAGLRRLLEAADGSVSVTVMGADEDLPAIRDICGAPAAETDPAQPSRAA